MADFRCSEVPLKVFSILNIESDFLAAFTCSCLGFLLRTPTE